MKTEIEGGGPAFPNPSLSDQNYPEKHDLGMTILDWFAGQVAPKVYQSLQGMPASRYVELFSKDASFASVTASESYDIAAAMIAEKKRRAGL